jgi:hypothetical protein
MSNRRRLLDRLFQAGAPGVDEAYRPPPARIGDGLWSLERKLRMPLGAALPSRTTIVRLAGGGLVLISPPPAHPETWTAIDALGRVDALVAPNSFHYLYVAAAVRQYPRATLYLAPGLPARVPALPEGIDLSERTPAPEIEQITLGPRRGISESVLFHRPSRLLVLTDLAFHMVDLERRFDRVFWRLFGVPSEFGPSRTARWMLLPPRAAAAPLLRRVLDWPFERIVVAHGEIVPSEARARFERAFACYL